MPADPGVAMIGKKAYAACAGCGEIIRINKPILGSIHICLTDEEQAELSREIEAKWRRNRRWLSAVRAVVGRQWPL